MLLYWGMFTLGFSIGAVFAFVAFAPKKPQDDPEYETSAQSSIDLLFNHPDYHKIAAKSPKIALNNTLDQISTKTKYQKIANLTVS